MSNSRKSFLLHFDSLCILDDLTDEQSGKLLKAMRDYHLGHELNLDPLLKIAFSPFKNQFIRDDEKYQEVVERNKNNGSKGGRPKKQQEPKKPSGLLENPVGAKKADSVNDNDSDNGNDNKSDKEKPKRRVTRFTPPTVDEVKEYCLERSNMVNPQSFIDHYESNGWMRGKTKMKDWKACVRTWEQNQKGSFKPSSHNLSNKVYESGDL